jgi:hypothetical protein
LVNNEKKVISFEPFASSNDLILNYHIWMQYCIKIHLVLFFIRTVNNTCFERLLVIWLLTKRLPWLNFKLFVGSLEVNTTIYDIKSSSLFGIFQSFLRDVFRFLAIDVSSKNNLGNGFWPGLFNHLLELTCWDWIDWALALFAPNPSSFF